VAIHWIVHNLLFHFSNIILFSFFITVNLLKKKKSTVNLRCTNDYDCPYAQLVMFKWKCIKGECQLFHLNNLTKPLRRRLRNQSLH
jgi:hypothetical protein